MDRAVQWTNGNAYAPLACTGFATNLTIHKTENYHSFKYGQELTHTAAECVINADSTQETIFTGISYGTISAIPVEIVTKNRKALIIPFGGNKPLYAISAQSGDAQVSTKCGEVWTDAKLALVQCDDNGIVLNTAFFDGNFVDIL